MSAAVVVAREDGIIVVADRAVVSGPPSGDGTVTVGEEAAKLALTRGGCVWALAGQAEAAGVDLRAIAGQLADSNPALAAQELRVRFEAVGSQFATAAWHPNGLPVPPFRTPVHTVTVLAGCWGGALEVHLVGLTASGSVEQQTLNRSDVAVFAPQSVLVSLSREAHAVLGVPDVADGRQLLVPAIRAAAVAEPALISFHLDEVVIRPDGVGSVTNHMYAGTAPPPGV